METKKLTEITPEAIAAAFPGVPIENKPPRGAGILLPDPDPAVAPPEQAPLPYDAAFINDNAEKFKGFFETGGVLLFTQDGHWVYGPSFMIAPALIKKGSNPEGQVKVFIIVGDHEPRVDEKGRILVRKPAQVYQACQVALSALLPPGFMRSEIVQPNKRLIVPG